MDGVAPHGTPCGRQGLGSPPKQGQLQTCIGGTTSGMGGAWAPGFARQVQAGRRQASTGRHALAGKQADAHALAGGQAGTHVLAGGQAGRAGSRQAEVAAASADSTPLWRLLVMGGVELAPLSSLPASMPAAGCFSFSSLGMALLASCRQQVAGCTSQPPCPSRAGCTCMEPRTPSLPSPAFCCSSQAPPLFLPRVMHAPSPRVFRPFPPSQCARRQSPCSC